MWFNEKTDILVKLKESYTLPNVTATIVILANIKL